MFVSGRVLPFVESQAMKSHQSITVVKTLLDHRASPNLSGERGQQQPFWKG